MSNQALTLQELAEMVGGRFVGDGTRVVVGAAPFENALPEEISLAGTPRFLKQIENCRAGILIVPETFICDSHALLQAANPQAAFTRILQKFYPPDGPPPGIHATAVIGRQFTCGQKVHIGPQVSIGNRVSLGDRVVLEAGVVLGDGVTLGDDVRLAPRVVVLANCRIGNRVSIQGGTVIGGDGFGYAPEAENWLKTPHRGIVQIDDDVEIGACNTIDRATFGRTWIQQGVKTDNLVHVAHNVVVGENSLLIAQAGISGSVTIGRHAIIGGQAGIVDHQVIGDHAIVGPQTGVGQEVAAKEVVFGSPQMPHRLFLKVSRLLTRLPELFQRVKRLETDVSKQESL